MVVVVVDRRTVTTVAVMMCTRAWTVVHRRCAVRKEKEDRIIFVVGEGWNVLAWWGL